MRTEYQYLGQMRTIQLPEGSKVIQPKEVPWTDGEAEIRRSLRNPIGSPSLEGFLSGRKSVLVIVNDITRPTPTSIVLESVQPFIKDKKVSVMVATGAHRAATEEEKTTILGAAYESLKNVTTSHDAHRQEDMVCLGTTRNGTLVEINKAVVENDCIIIIGSVEPHYFAGFSGGRKAIMPGVASYRSIQMNHKLALSPKARALNLKDNPVHADMADALGLLGGKPIFAAMVVADKQHRIHKVFCGNIIGTFEAAAKSAEEVFCVGLEHKYDIVVTVAAPPMDLDLYQSQKALDNAKLAVKDGGIIILVSPCREGLGGRAFYELLSSSPSPEGAIEAIEQGYVLGFHKAAKMAETMLKARVFAVSGLEAKTLRKIFIKSFDSLEAALDEALGETRNGSVLFIKDGGVVVPKVCG